MFTRGIANPLPQRFRQFALWTAGLAVALAASIANRPALAAQTAPAAPAAACPSILQHTHARLQDEKPQNLCQYAGQVVLVVNTASYCGFTPQYQGLEKLYRDYRAQGLVVLGFPSNDFAQEPGGNDKIAEFCENTYGVKFPMFTKTAVRGQDAAPLFRQLSARSDTTPKWNFYKYLIARDGQRIQAFNSMTAPTDARLIQAIEQLLKQPPPQGR